LQFKETAEISDLARDIPEGNLEYFSLFDFINSVSERSSKTELCRSECQGSRELGSDFNFLSDNFIISKIDDRLSGGYGNKWFDIGF
jgi:hypothetical protein